MDTKAQQARNVVVTAGQILSGLGLVTAFGHVSQRTGDRMVITPGADLAVVTSAADLVEVSLDATTLPPRAPAEAWAHLAVYAARPDVRAIARAQPPAAFAAAAALSGQSAPAGPVALPPLYGQACWLGPSVPVHPDARLLRSDVLAKAAAATLGESDALLLRGNGALTCGPAPGHAVARMWLLAAACQAWLSATAAGPAAVLSPAEIESWRAVQTELLPRLWEHLAQSVSIPKTRSSLRERTARG